MFSKSSAADLLKVGKIVFLFSLPYSNNVVVKVFCKSPLIRNIYTSTSVSNIDLSSFGHRPDTGADCYKHN